MPLLYDRIKQSMISANHAATFFKKRAAIEDEYGRSMIKLSRGTAEAYAATEAKAGTFVNTWQTFMKTHETIGENRIRFGQKLAEISDELVNLAKEVDKNRKYARDTGMRLEKNLTDAELSVEKSRSRFDAAAEDLERLLLLKSGESARGGELHGLSQSNGPPGKRTLGKAIGKSSLLFKNKNPQQVLRQEEDIRSRTANASDAFRKEVQSTQTIRSDYFRLQLPRILRVRFSEGRIFSLSLFRAVLLTFITTNSHSKKAPRRSTMACNTTYRGMHSFTKARCWATGRPSPLSRRSMVLRGLRALSRRLTTAQTSSSSCKTTRCCMGESTKGHVGKAHMRRGMRNSQPAAAPCHL